MPDPKFTEARVSFSSCSAEVAAKLGIGGVVNMATSASRRVLLVSVMLVNAEEHVQERDPATGRPTLIRNRGFGARLAVEVSRADVESDVSLSFLAARADFSTSKSSLDVEGFGLPDTLASELVAIEGDLSADSLVAIRRFFTQSLPSYMRGSAVAEGTALEDGQRLALGLHPVFVHAPAREQYSPLHSINFAIRHIATGTPLDRAVEFVRNADVIEDAVAESIVKDMYTKFGAGEGAPSASAVKKASQWLQEARGK